ncbi:MAG: response regulator [Candidatus Omnitrophota bacterium]
MGKNIRILMIDDEEDFTEPMAFWLRSKGHEVDTVTSGEKGLGKISENAPDIVFLDIFMPVMNGVETLRRIREIDLDIPVIMLTSAVVENVQESYSMGELDKLGVSGFFKKKDSFEELARLLEITLRLHKDIPRSEE